MYVKTKSTWADTYWPTNDSEGQDQDYALCLEQNSAEACRKMVYTPGVAGDLIRKVSTNVRANLATIGIVGLLGWALI